MIESEKKRKRKVFQNVELLEVSAVGIPSYHDAVKSVNFDDAVNEIFQEDEQMEDQETKSPEPSNITKGVEVEEMKKQIELLTKQLGEMKTADSNKIIKESVEKAVEAVIEKKRGLSTDMNEQVTAIKYVRGKENEFFKSLGEEFSKIAPDFWRK